MSAHACLSLIALLFCKVLRFYAYFQEDVLHSADEKSRVRSVVIYYHLEDDGMCIVEPPVENSGMPQGTVIKRQRLPKNTRGDHYYHWKDLNLGMDLEVYGVTYRITHCDAYTNVCESSPSLCFSILSICTAES